jgi:hypothetical protein
MSQEEIFKAMPDGTEYRVRLVRDSDPQKPEDDGQWPILRLYYNNRYGWEAEAFNEQAKPYCEAFNRLKEGGYPTQTFERYVRIFHGASRILTYGPNQVTDYTYMAFDPAAWREAVGVTVEGIKDELPLSEVIAWLEGDVWGWVSEYRDNTSGIADDDDWEEESSCYGLYGRDYAEEAAQEELSLLVSQHKERNRKGRAQVDLIRRKLGGRLMASMESHHDKDGNPTLKGVLGPVEVNLYTAPDGAIVVMIDSPTQSDSEHPSLRIHLNDDTLYNASAVPIEAPETEGEN